MELFPGGRCRLILIGKTGCGKSSTGNTILGKDVFDAETGINSKTKKCSLGFAKRQGLEILVMDTPGLSDTDDEDRELTKKITKSLIAVKPGPHAVLLCLRCDMRFTNEEYEVYEALKRIFGEQMKSYLVVMMLGADRLKGASSSFEDQLSKSKLLKKLFGEADNRYLLFNNYATGDEKSEQVDRLLAIVRGLVKENGGGYFKHNISDEMNDSVAAMMKEEVQLHLSSRAGSKDSSSTVKSRKSREAKEELLSPRALQMAERSCSPRPQRVGKATLLDQGNGQAQGQAKPRYKQAKQDQRRAKPERQGAGEECKQAEQGQGQAGSGHRQAKEKLPQAKPRQGQAKQEQGQAGAEHRQAKRERRRARAEHQQAKQEGGQTKADYEQTKPEHRKITTEHGQAKPKHQRVKAEVCQDTSENKQGKLPHRRERSENRQGQPNLLQIPGSEEQVTRPHSAETAASSRLQDLEQLRQAGNVQKNRMLFTLRRADSQEELASAEKSEALDVRDLNRAAMQKEAAPPPQRAPEKIKKEEDAAIAAGLASLGIQDWSEEEKERIERAIRSLQRERAATPRPATALAQLGEEEMRGIEDLLLQKIVDNEEELTERQRRQLEEVTKSVGLKLRGFKLPWLHKCSLM